MTMNFLKTLRNNWKKSTLAVVITAYGVRYVDTEITNNGVLRSFCEEAVKFGDQPLPVNNSPRKIVVILNPAANKRKAKNEFERYCAPILNLSGASINVITTEEENGARNIVENLSEKFDAIVVAGGDGTLSEVVTGLLRRFDGNGAKSRSIPIGILPLGRTNTIANKLYCYNGSTKSDKIKHVRSLANASFAIINEDTEKLNILRIENMENENNSRPVYAVGGLQWGAFRNAHIARDNFWYFGKFRTYATYVLGYQKRNKKVDALIEYSSPCSGCKNCYETREELKPVTDSRSSRWWNIFLPIKKSKEISVDYTLIENEKCGVILDRNVKSVELHAVPSFIGEKIPKINISIGPEQIGYFNFIREGWKRERNMEPSVQEVIEAQKIKITPVKTDVEETLSIDNEEYEVKKMCITLLQHSLTVFKMCQLNI